MPDPLSIATCIIGLIDIGSKLFLCLWNIGRGILGSRRNIELFEAEIENVSNILKHIHCILALRTRDGQSYIPLPVLENLNVSSSLHKCEQLEIQFHNILQSTCIKKAWLAKMGLWCKWSVVEKDLLRLRRALETQKSDLQLTLGLMSCLLVARNNRGIHAAREGIRLICELLAMDVPPGLPHKTGTGKSTDEIDLCKYLESKGPRGLDTLKRLHGFISTPTSNSRSSPSSTASLNSTNDMNLTNLGQEANSKPSININIPRDPKGKSKIHNNAKCGSLGGAISREAGHCSDSKIRLRRGNELRRSMEEIEITLGMQLVTTFGNVRRSLSLESWDGTSTVIGPSCRSSLSSHGQSVVLAPPGECLSEYHDMPPLPIYSPLPTRQVLVKDLVSGSWERLSLQNGNPLPPAPSNNALDNKSWRRQLDREPSPRTTSPDDTESLE